MEIVVIDGQGGGIGKNIIQVLKEKCYIKYCEKNYYLP